MCVAIAFRTQTRRARSHWNSRLFRRIRHNSIVIYNSKFTNARNIPGQFSCLFFVLRHSTCVEQESISKPKIQTAEEKKKKQVVTCPYLFAYELREYTYATSYFRPFCGCEIRRNKKKKRMKNDCRDVIRCHHLKFIGNLFVLHWRLFTCCHIPIFSGFACWASDIR